MKKVLLALFFIIITILLVLLIISLSPKKINIVTTAMKYAYDDVHFQHGEAVEVKINGEVINKRRTGQRNFIGYIEIEGEQNPVSQNKRLNIALFEENWGIMTYTEFIDPSPQRFKVNYYNAGLLYANHNFKQFAFVLTTDYDFNLPLKSIIVLPSKNSEETLNIINDIKNFHLDSVLNNR